MSPDDPTPEYKEIVLQQQFNSQVWTDGESYTFNVSELDKNGLIIGDAVVLITAINSAQNNTQIYGIVTNTLVNNKLTILVERTVIE